MTKNNNDIDKQLDALEKRFQEICNTPVMRLIHEMAEERKAAAKAYTRKWLRRFVCDEQLK